MFVGAVEEEKLMRGSESEGDDVETWNIVGH